MKHYALHQPLEIGDGTLQTLTHLMELSGHMGLPSLSGDSGAFDLAREARPAEALPQPDGAVSVPHPALSGISFAAALRRVLRNGRGRTPQNK